MRPVAAADVHDLVLEAAGADVAARLPLTRTTDPATDPAPHSRQEIHDGPTVTLFTGQWADLPFEEVCRLAGEWGYDGLEIACWGDHFEVDRALSDDGYIDVRREILEPSTA